MSNDYPPPPPPPQGGDPSQWGQPPPQGGGPSPWGQQPPPGYGYPQGYGGQPPKRSVLALTSLILGILGVIPCCWGCAVFSIAAMVTSFLGKKEIAESQGMKTGADLAKWGWILGIVGIVFSVLYWILVATGVIDLTAYSELN